MKRPEFQVDVAKTQQINPRSTPEDWVDALIEAGPKRIRISRLARRLGVTPGSFYWHFRDRESLRDRALEHWRPKMLETAGVEPEDAALRARMIFWNFLGSRGAEPELRIRGFKELIEVLTPNVYPGAPSEADHQPEINPDRVVR